jgi:uroporphyrinogen-III synthase
MVTSKKELDTQFLPIFQRMLEEGNVNTMVFPSAASVGVFIDSLKKCSIDVYTLLKDVQVVCMGKHTKAAVEAAGLIADAFPKSATREALVEYLVQCPAAKER